MPDRIPLFPLGTVLYPGLLLPLHIFEDRYRALVQHLVDLPDGSDRVFGVIAIREGREVGADGVRALHDVGCVTELRQVQAYPDGRFDIVSAAVSRFRLISVDESEPWLTAVVERLPEGDADGGDGGEAPVLAASLRRLFPRYRAALTGAGGGRDDDDGEETDDTDDELPADPTVLSYLVAAAVVLDLADKQALLAAPDVTDRLRRELALLRRESAIMRRLPAIPATDLVRTGYGVN